MLRVSFDNVLAGILPDPGLRGLNPAVPAHALASRCVGFFLVLLFAHEMVINVQNHQKITISDTRITMHLDFYQ